MNSRGYGLSDVGVERSNNEDAYLVDDELGLYVVCDGLGGHAGGEVAAKLAVEACRKLVAKNSDTLLDAKGKDYEHGQLRKVARSAVEEACKDVYSRALAEPELAGMGCTLTFLLISGRCAVMAHVGDTRLYLCRDDATSQMSTDHTMAADLVRRGELTPDGLENHSYSSVLTRAIGGQEAIRPEILILDVLPDDRFLLCSDGLSTYLEGLGELNRMLLDPKPSAVPQHLIDLANERGGRDNVTALVVQVEATDEEQTELAALAEDIREHDLALQKVALFENLRFAERLRVLRISTRRSLNQGELLFDTGDELHELYVPVRGGLELVTSRGADKLSTGTAVGGTSLLVPRTAWASLRAVTDATVLVIDARDFLKLAQRRPWLGVSLMSELALGLGRELAEAGQAIEDSSSPSLSWWNPRRWI